MDDVLSGCNPCPESSGHVMFEHWERHGDTMRLLAVASEPTRMGLATGDVILERRWAPASGPTVYMAKD